MANPTATISIPVKMTEIFCSLLFNFLWIWSANMYANVPNAIQQNARTISFGHALSVFTPLYPKYKIGAINETIFHHSLCAVIRYIIRGITINIADKNQVGAFNGPPLPADVTQKIS